LKNVSEIVAGLQQTTQENQSGTHSCIAKRLPRQTRGPLPNCDNRTEPTRTKNEETNETKRNEQRACHHQIAPIEENEGIFAVDKPEERQTYDQNKRTQVGFQLRTVVVVVVADDLALTDRVLRSLSRRDVARVGTCRRRRPTSKQRADRCVVCKRTREYDDNSCDKHTTFVFMLAL
jgi:hypothetical protein